MRPLLALGIAGLILSMGVGTSGDARERRQHVDPPPVKVEAPVVVTDACRRGGWQDATPDVVAQAGKLLEQYGAAKTQLAALGASGVDTVVVYRSEAKDAYLIKETPVYRGEWGEVRSALQDMLSRRLASIACKLQALGVTVSEQKISAL